MIIAEKTFIRISIKELPPNRYMLEEQIEIDGATYLDLYYRVSKYDLKKFKITRFLIRLNK